MGSEHKGAFRRVKPHDINAVQPGRKGAAVKEQK
jgi:hypothetical protein